MNCAVYNLPVGEIGFPPCPTLKTFGGSKFFACATELKRLSLPPSMKRETPHAPTMLCYVRRTWESVVECGKFCAIQPGASDARKRFVNTSGFLVITCGWYSRNIMSTTEALLGSTNPAWWPTEGFNKNVQADA